MKYVILLPDGAADWPLPSYGNKTPLELARTPNLDSLAAEAVLGTACHTPLSLPPGSDVATLSLLGYNPLQCYSGRAPLEAIAQGVELSEHDWAIRCNLVTLEHLFPIETATMRSFTADHISSGEAAELMRTAQETLPKWFEAKMTFLPGVGYRNLLVWRGSFGKPAPFGQSTHTVPPHDIVDQSIETFLPTGAGAAELRQLIVESGVLFAEHPVNMRRRRGTSDEGRVASGEDTCAKLPATHLWPWGQGKKPVMVPFAEKYGIAKGGMITAVDLLRGIGKMLGWEQIAVPGATGYTDTNYAGKGQFAAAALDHLDIVCVHIEAPDEAGHEGDVAKKVEAIERIDRDVLPPILESLRKHGQWRILVSPDHPTPIAKKTHSHDPVPWLLAGSGITPNHPSDGPPPRFTEKSATETGFHFEHGWEWLGWALDEGCDCEP